MRNQVGVKLSAATLWQLAATLFTGAPSCQVFGAVQLVRAQPFSCQLLRYRHVLKGREHRTVRGGIRQATASRAAARSQREPWLLAYSHSLQHLSAAQIVTLHRKRMQIELSFRDLKSDQYGCAFEHSLTRKLPRMALLLLLHALACFVAWLQGLALVQLKQITHCVPRLHARRAHY